MGVSEPRALTVRRGLGAGASWPHALLSPFPVVWGSVGARGRAVQAAALGGLGWSWE